MDIAMVCSIIHSLSLVSFVTYYEIHNYIPYVSEALPAKYLY